MERNPSVDEVAEHFTEYLNRVADHGEHFVLTRATEPVAELRPVPRTRRLSELPALLRALPPLSPPEAVSFGEDLAAAAADLGTAELRDPWPS